MTAGYVSLRFIHCVCFHLRTMLIAFTFHTDVINQTCIHVLILFDFDIKSCLETSAALCNFNQPRCIEWCRMDEVK